MKFADINYKMLLKPTIVIIVVGFLYATVLMKLGQNWWVDENYSHGLLVPFIIGYVIWLNFDVLKKAAEGSSFFLGVLLVVSALMMLLAGTLGAELFIQRISLVLMLIGIVVYFFGTRILQLLVLPLALLLLAIPIPQIIFNKIAFPLQIYASQMSIWGIRLFQIPTIRKGNVIEILPQNATQVIALEVVEACSGIRSLMTLMTLALILAYFTRESSSEKIEGWTAFLTDTDFWRAVILMFSAIPIAIITNAGRVMTTGVLTYYYGKQATAGTAHDVAGWLVYIVALVMLLVLNIVLKAVFNRYFLHMADEK